MKLSWNCLNELINLNQIKQIEVANQLTLAGFETENIIYNSQINDTIFEIDITANRKDVKSIIDIALEISAINRQSLMIDSNITKNYHKYNLQIQKITTTKILTDFDQFNFSMLKNINLRHNYQHIKNYLIAYDLKPTNTILDFINFINIKWGQKIQIYKMKSRDYNTIHDFNFHIKTNNKSTNLGNNINIYFNNKILEEINGNNINNHSSIENIIIITYKIKNPSQYNFDFNNNKLNTNWILNAYKEIFDLLQINNKYPTIYLKNNLTKKTNVISCKKSKIDNILGPIIKNKRQAYLEQSDIIKILEALNFKVFTHQNEIQIYRPKYRREDIQKDIDVIEEIGRIYGFNSFKDQLPTFHHLHRLHDITLIKQKIRKILRSMGLHETINYAIYSHANSNCISLINPLNKDQAFLRTNLINGLIKSQLYNINQSNHTFEVFEIGKIFLKNSQHFYQDENLHIAGLLGNKNFNQSSWNNQEDELSWFQAKGHLEELFEKINAQINWTKHSMSSKLIQNIQKYLHITRTAYITHNKQLVGIFSQLNNKTKKHIGSKHNIYVFEINISKLVQSFQAQKHLKNIYIPYSPYPKIIRDTSIKINQNISLQYLIRLINIIKKKNNDFLESIHLLNEYHEIDGTKNINLRTIYRSRSKTLTNKEIKILDNTFKRNIKYAIAGKQSKT